MVSRALSSTADVAVAKPTKSDACSSAWASTKAVAGATGSGGFGQSVAGEGIRRFQLARNVLHIKTEFLDFASSYEAT
jgi:hypothetical protein